MLFFLRVVPCFIAFAAADDYAEHDDVPTNVTPVSLDVQADWEHDFFILKEIVENRGFNTSSSTHLCELPCTYCNAGYRRRVPAYAKNLMGDWVGSAYQVILKIKSQSEPAAFPTDIFNLRRVGFLQVYVNSGQMPSGIHRLNRLKMFWVEGNRTHGLEGGLPADFWSVRTRMFLLASMGPQFTGHLEQDLPLCDHLDYRFYLYRLPSLSGDISGLQRCKKVQGVFEVFLNPRLGGNVWETLLSWDRVVGSINMWGSNFSGRIPFDEKDPWASEEVRQDPWVQWCEARANARLNFKVVQQVGGQLPPGLVQCSNIFTKFDVQDSDISGRFPLQLAGNVVMGPVNLKLWRNKFTGPIPDIPNQTSKIDLHSNQWTGGIPSSWSLASNLEIIDLSDCGILGPLPDSIGTARIVKMNGNRYHGQVPELWVTSPNLEYLDLSDNHLRGPPFQWGWPGDDPNGNFDPSTFLDVYSQTPPWPLKTLLLSNNPLGISTGFLLGMLTHYELEVLHAANCSLHGYANSEDFFAHAPASGGGVTTKSDGIAFTLLRDLSLAENNLDNFGYNDMAGSPSCCWPEDSWSLRLPSLEKLDLHNCGMMKRIHPRAFTLKEVNLQGTKSLIAPPLVNHARDCDNVLGVSSEVCSGTTWGVCFHRVNTFIGVPGSTGLECADIGMRWMSDVGNILIEPDVFDQHALCRCREGSGEFDGDSCTPVLEQSMSSDEQKDDQLNLVLPIVFASVVAVLIILATISCIIGRRRKKRGEVLATDQAEHIGIVIGADTKTPTTSQESSEQNQESCLVHAQSVADPVTEADTTQLFAQFNMVEIVAKGMEEHWTIMPDQISLTQLNIAKGGFGSVARGFMFSTTDVAVKIPQNKLTQDHAYALANEIRLFRRLRHANIVLFYGVTVTKFDGDPQLSLVLEWINGGDLQKYIQQRRRSGQFDWDAKRDSINIMPETVVLIDVARGMQFLHGQDPPIVHRDLKPANILIEASDPPRGKISDFGLSMHLHVRASGRAGTSSYMAPEVNNHEDYDERADVFSFGCVCYYALTAHSPRGHAAQQDCIILEKMKGKMKAVAQVAISCLHVEPSKRTSFCKAYFVLSEMNYESSQSTLEGTSRSDTSFIESSTQAEPVAIKRNLNLSTKLWDSRNEF